MVRRTAIYEIGLLDENFFYDFEDVEIGYGMWKHGWRVMYIPYATAIHVGHQSVKNILPEASRQMYRGRLYFFEKNYGRRSILLIKLISGLASVTNIFAWTFALALRRNDRERARLMIAENFYLLKSVFSETLRKR